LLDTGAVLAFGLGLDRVAPLNRSKASRPAVTRQTLDGKHPDGWDSEQKITIDEAVRGFTPSAPLSLNSPRK